MNRNIDPARIRQALKEGYLKQGIITNELKISGSNVSAMIAGRIPIPKKHEPGIAKALNKSLAWLKNEEEEPVKE